MKIVEQPGRGPVQIGQVVQAEAEDSDHRLQDHHARADHQESSVDAHEEQSQQETDRQGAADHRNPFGGVKKAVLSVIGQAEDEVADETAQGQEQHPHRPIDLVRLDHAVHDRQKADAGISQRCDKRCRVHQAGHRSFLKEVTFQMQDQPSDAQNDGRPADDVAENAPQRHGGEELRRPTMASSSTPGAASE